MARSTETLDLFRNTYVSLKALGEEGLGMAYTFGNLVNALHGLYTFKQLGEEIGRTGSCVAMYKKLYASYVNRGGERELLRIADEMGSYDIARLAGAFDAPKESFRFVPHCSSCGSYNVAKEKMSADKAAEITEKVKAAQKGTTEVKFVSA